MRRIISIYGLLVIVLFSSAISIESSDFIDFGPVLDRYSKVKAALLPGVYLVKQQYVVVDSSGNEFGANNLNYFNNVYHFGAKMGNQIIVPQNFNKPGEIDSAFQSYRGSYTASVNYIAHRLATDTTGFEEVKLKDYDEGTCTFSVADGQGFARVDYKNVKEGKLLLFYTDDLNSLDGRAAFPYVVEVNDLKWNNGKANVKDIRYKDKKAVGGMLFYEEVSFGAIHYKLVGFYENIGGDWQIVALNEAAPTSTPPQLNPIGGKGKR